MIVPLVLNRAKVKAQSKFITAVWCSEKRAWKIGPIVYVTAFDCYAASKLCISHAV